MSRWGPASAFAAPRLRRDKKAGPYVLQGLLGAIAIAFAVLAYSYLTLPDVRLLKTNNPQTTAFMELRAAEARAKGQQPRRAQRWVAYGRVSPNLTRAVLVAEDDLFWQHEGLDFDQLQESLALDWARGRFTRGGSTITQQLAKNLYLSPSKNPMRKLRELLIARRLEAELKKARILELYLNVIEWGDGIYGAQAAARRYYAKPVSDLEPAEAAGLAAMIPNPRRINPLVDPRRHARAQRRVLWLMASAGYIERDAAGLAEAVRGRGVEVSGVRGHARLLSPLVAGSLERAANLAEAMEARGFGSGAPTRAPSPDWRFADYAALAAGAALVAAAVLWL